MTPEYTAISKVPDYAGIHRASVIDLLSRRYALSDEDAKAVFAIVSCWVYDNPGKKD